MKYLLIAFLLLSPAIGHSQAGGWISTFELSPAAYQDLPMLANLPKQYAYLRDKSPTNGTLRYRFAISVGGDRVRVRLSDEVGDKPLHIQSASLGLAASGPDAVEGSLHHLTFNGRDDVLIPAGAPELSDSLDFPVKRGSELIVSVFVDEGLPQQPLSGVVLQRGAGDQVMSPQVQAATKVKLRPIVSGLLVETTSPAHVIVGFGDSITDGARAVPNQPHGWVAELNERIADTDPSSAVVTAGIGGNRVLRDGWGPSALARADRDVFAVPGVTSVIMLEGINDIGMAGNTVTGEEPVLHVGDLIAGYRQLAARAHVRHLKIYLGTLTPFRGAPYFTEDKEKQRLAVNAWIRSNKDFDGVIDFDKALQDPEAPDRMNPKLDSGDHLHPSEAGYEAMSESIPAAFIR